MSTLLKVARYHLVDRLQYVVLPIGVTLFSFLVNMVVFRLVNEPNHSYSGGLLTLYVFLFVSGVLSVAKSLPFGLTLGLSRRSYYLGTLTFVVALSTVFSLGVVLLQVLERVTSGWGQSLYFFRVPWLLDGSWYGTFVTSLVLLMLFFLYGMWFGLVYRRWAVLGSVLFIVAQVVALLAAAVLITVWESWPAVGEFFGTLSVFGFIGVLAAVAVALGAGGFATLRRVTV